MILLWTALAGAIAVWLEFQFRQGIGWLPNLWWIAPASLLLNFALWQVFSTSREWLPASALFALCTLSGRTLLAIFVLREPVTVPVIVAIAALGGGAIVRQAWR